MDYTKTILREYLVIKKIVTVHYFEFAKNYIFEGEKHDFWELLYVDKGEVEVMSDIHGYKLKQGEMIFHKPNQFHNEWANGKVAPNLVVISFECKSKEMEFFANKIISIGNNEKNLLAQVIREAKTAFKSRLDDSLLKKLDRRDNAEFGCEQLIKIHLEQMLILLIRKGTGIVIESRLSSAIKERSDEDMTKKIINYLLYHVTDNINFEDVCRYSYIGRTNLKIMFKEHTGKSVMEYYKNLKIEEAKKMIREGLNNFTEISELLSYTSIHYFSRHFKKATDMTPSEYASSVQIKI
ncbi:MAG TPA: AraC family transcriptional regulator [Ruminiclostridium sp.]